MDDQIVAAIINLAGYDLDAITPNAVEQMGILLEAFDIFMQRDPHHKSLWKQSGLEDCMLHVRSKAGRFAVDPANHTDDGLDLINYAVFAIRLVAGEV